ncbi:MAG: RNase P subunit [Nitrososphaerales archaeon]
MKKVKDIAYQRVKRLIYIALDTARYDLDLAKKQAELARRIQLRFNLRLPFELKRFFCHSCKQFLVFGVNSRIRIRSKILTVTCLNCKHVYRKILNKKSL